MNTVPASDKIYDIYGFWHIPFWQTGWFWWSMVAVIILLSILFFSFIALYVARRRKKIKKRDFLAEVAAISIKKGLTKEEAKQFYFKLTLLLKYYFAERVESQFMGKTDKEVLRTLEKEGLFSDKFELINILFSGGERIKYAGEEALYEQLLRDKNNAIIIIKQTGQSDLSHNIH